MGFYQNLQRAWDNSNSLLCVGLDPDPTKLPAMLRDQPDAIFQFNKAIIDATAHTACAFKPQIAYYAAVSAEDQLLATIAYIKQNYPEILVVLDSKRGDIGSTASMYAREAFIRYQADSVTVNPYMGGDSLQPFLDYADKGVIVLCRTSNPGGSDLQNLALANEELLYQKVAALAAQQWNNNNNVCLVVGATFPEELAQIRAIVGEMPLLVPGLGAQGGDVEKAVKAGVNGAGTGMMINSSRGIIYAGAGNDFAEAATAAAEQMRDEINQYR